jgi:hypothetical protein
MRLSLSWLTTRPFGTWYAGLHAKLVAELLQQPAGAEHVIGDAVAEQDVIVAARLFMQEGIESDDTANFSFGQLQQGGELCDCRPGDVREPVLELAKILQQTRPLNVG